MMDAFSGHGEYEITEEMKKDLEGFVGGFATEEETADTIRKVYKNADYIMDTHTAVASHVYYDKGQRHRTVRQ